MKKNKTKHEKTIGNHYSPYPEGTMTWYEAYENDPYKCITLNGKTYKRIISRCEFYCRDEFTLLVTFEPNEALYLGDTLVDEDKREFVIKAFEMFRLTGSKLPEWHKIVSVAIQGKSYNIGDYLRKQDDNE